jgi:hypothetical protein
VNVQNRGSRRRKGQAIVRVVFGLGAMTAGVLAYLLSDGSRVEAIVLPSLSWPSCCLALLSTAALAAGRNGQRPGTLMPGARFPASRLRDL